MQTVGCDKIVDSNSTIDKCGVCGGDGMSCKTITKTFTDSPKFGYKTIGTIPAGSRNIKIAEAEESRNYLGRWADILWSENVIGDFWYSLV